MTSNNLEKLPTDILSGMLSTMTVEAVSNLKLAVKGKDEFIPIELECNRAMSVARYLKDTLGHGRELLVILSKCFAYIGGSRSLEFFVPGCIDESSDLDLYVPNMTNMGKAMRLLAALGVKWRSVEDDIRTCARNREGQVLIGSSALLSLRASNALEKACSDNALELIDFLNVHCRGMVVVEVEDNKMRTYFAPDNTGYAKPAFSGMVNGTLLHKGKNIKVQLICEQRQSGLMGVDGLARYHSSCVQSFIGGHIACHLHGKMARDKLSYGWPINTSDVEIIGTPNYEENLWNLNDHGKVYVVPAWVKYQRRGFKYIHAPGPTNVVRRTLFDSECTTVEYLNDAGAPSEVSSAYRRSAEGTWWCQTSRGITGVWTSTKVKDMSGGFTEHSWFSSDDVHKDQWYLHNYHVAYTSLV
jgi:hypothetical protein